jgi:hypothetical protein
VRQLTGAYQASVNAIVGVARDADGELLAHARLQLRDLKTGAILQRTTTNSEGAFVFKGVDPGTYIVEVTNNDGSVIALSDATTVANGEIVRVAVHLTTRVRSFSWWLGSITSAALAQAASIGVLTVDPGQAVTPVR